MPYFVFVVGRCLWGAGVFYRCFLESRPAVQGIFLLRFLAGASFAGSLSAGEVVNFALWTGVALWICASMCPVKCVNHLVRFHSFRFL